VVEVSSNEKFMENERLKVCIRPSDAQTTVQYVFAFDQSSRFRSRDFVAREELVSSVPFVPHDSSD
jgi:hypothetical protein